MSQFLGQNLLKAQYFNAAYLHGAASELSAPSGMRRLMLYELQEEALKKWSKKDEQKQGQEAPRRESEAAPTEPVAAPVTRPKRPRRQRTAEPTPHAPVLPFRQRPVVIEPTAYDVLAQLPPLAFRWYSTQVLSVTLAPVVDLNTERERRRSKARRRAAAILLLAA